MKRFAELRGLMTANDYTIPQVARAAGIGSTAMSQRLNSHAPFTLDEVFPLDGKKN